MEKYLCPNCGGKVDAPYCPRYGQRRGEARLSWSVLREGAMSALIGRGFGGEKGSAERYGVRGTLWRHRH